MNPFDHASAAARYAAHRPAYHSLVLQLAQRQLRWSAPLKRVVDVACGTGQNSLALCAVARNVVACDGSLAMLAEAKPHPAVRYLCSQAEALPLRAATAELITVASAFHWLDQPRFLREAHRVLVPRGQLLIYNGGFSKTMQENREYGQWMRKRYRKRFPVIRRNASPITAESMAPHGFELTHYETFSHNVEFTRAGLAGYLTTHSNVIARVEAGHETLDSAMDWLQSELKPFFPSQSMTLPFGGSIFYLERRSQEPTFHAL